LILPPKVWDAWIRGTPQDAKAIVDTTVEPELAYYPVTKAVGAPKNDTPVNVEESAID
jgi:putative SOS response-associated peptidase YedK